MSQKVGEFLRHDPLKLRFTTTNSTGTPKPTLKHSLNQTISEIIAPSYLSQQPAMILYELLDVSIIELEAKRSLKVIWISINEEQSTHSFLLSRTSLVNDLCSELAKCAKLTPNGANKIRVFHISKDGKRQEECMGNAVIGDIVDDADLFAEEVPQEELDALSVPERAKVIMVYHFYREPSRAHGVPFRFVLRPVRRTVSGGIMVFTHSFV
jgi:ubiquitin carboxyl-terminal hydrolase 7